MKKRILIVAAHPDDEALGCGGTVARLIKEGHEAFTLILGEGITSRDRRRDVHRREADIKKLRGEAGRANKILGVKEVYFFDFPDNRFDTVALLDIVKAVEEVKRRIKPSIIFTHYEKDLNVDHQIVYKAVITAARPVKEESVKEIYSSEMPSSTEWSYPLAFSPDIFFDISGTIHTKLNALKAYETELRKYPHPRSAEGVKLMAKTWGMKTGLGYAEAFKTVRSIR
ncbi:MAG: PIG-L family deacetylase [Candidatus Omnitrophica bacterium]|nr:PIG-L family deacetylase [Candidatus Omnitrophota bacterium]